VVGQAESVLHIIKTAATDGRIDMRKVESVN
jgi:hypothetical protein